MEAGGEGGAELRDAALEAWQTRFSDDDAGMAVEEWDRSWSRLDDYRGVNANMHGVGDPRRRRRAGGRRRGHRAAASGQGAAHHAPGDRLGAGARLAAARALPVDWTPLPEFDRDRPVVKARMHWVLGEAVAAAAVMAEVTGEARYRERARIWRAHGERTFADPATGNWQLAPRTHGDGRDRERHLGGAARRLPPGPDAAPRRPAGPGSVAAALR